MTRIARLLLAEAEADARHLRVRKGRGQTGMDEITGGSLYGATAVAAGDGSRQPSENELDGGRFQVRHIAEITSTLGRGGGEKRSGPLNMQNETNTTGGTSGEP